MTANLTPSLAGRAAIITGASQGLGLAIAQAYVQAGANVLLCARDLQMLAQARETVTAAAPAGAVVEAMSADVANPSDVADLVERALKLFPQVHILVNNAGVYGPKGPLEEVDWHEWARAFEINVFGSVLMARALIGHFKAYKYGKIVQLSGGGATNPLPRISAYAASKAAVVRLAETLAVELAPWHVDVNSVAPGALNTRLLDEVLAAGPEKVGPEFYAKAQAQQEKGGTPLERGAELCVFLASAASDGITGKLISAVWDPWPDLPEHRADLADTDIYTLRRIVPADRGKKW